MLEEDLQITTISNRIKGFHRAMADGGLPVKPDSVISMPTRRVESAVLPWQPEEAFRVAQALVKRPERRTRWSSATPTSRSVSTARLPGVACGCRRTWP